MNKQEKELQTTVTKNAQELKDLEVQLEVNCQSYRTNKTQFVYFIEN